MRQEMVGVCPGTAPGPVLRQDLDQRLVESELPPSTSLSAVVAVTIFVTEATPKRVSLVIGTWWPRCAMPPAYWE